MLANDPLEVEPGAAVGRPSVVAGLPVLAVSVPASELEMAAEDFADYERLLDDYATKADADVVSGAAKRLVLTGEAVDADEALRIGLVEQLLPRADLYAKAEALAGSLAELPGLALESAKATFAAAQEPDFDDWERAQFAACWSQPERKAAMEAFLKRWKK